ncbi:conserved hypothetical protein [Sporisorium reilianum SRZ2]|uniref:Uncharacterized protein n=1 Tax=Sporisorium reilianum (strain SRZ2) TaxID=999809 RepID=E6ZPH3_SPORE|nr:conserved hypothetical protein [Sporisorium reilianum SRZ2]
MKAIFSSFGRRVNVDRGQDSVESPRKPSPSSVTQPRVIYSSYGTPGGNIGDAPAKAVDHRVSPINESTTSAWASRFSGSPRGTPPHRRKGGAEQNDDDTTTSSRPPHPPSSYREPSRQVPSTGATARGLVRKWSVASKRGSPPSDPRVSGSEPTLAKLHPSSTDLGSPSRTPVSSDRAQTSTHVPNHGPIGATSASPATQGVAGADISVMTSAQLASRLNELAVANADGLLTDDEYRTLRQAVFHQMLRADQQSMAAPTDTGLTGIGLPARDRHPDVAATNTTPNGNDHLSVDLPHAGSSQGHGDQRPLSIHSTRSGTSSSFHNVGQLFRTRRQNSQDSHSAHDASSRSAPMRRDSEGVSSQLSSGDGHSQRASSFRTQHSAAGKSLSRMSTLGRMRAGSQARREQAETAARDMEDAFSAERTARSLRAVSLYDAGSATLSIGGSAPQDKSPTSLRADVAPSTMYGAEYVDKSSSEIQAEMGVVLAEGNRMLGTFTVLEDTLLAKHASLDPLSVRRLIDTLRDSNPSACISSLALPDRAPPPSSYRPPPTATKAVHALVHDATELTASAEVAKLHTELASIYTQKAAVVRRYQDRLAFLQSKLRSAAIREGLR